MQQIIAPIFQQNHEQTYVCLPAKPINCEDAIVKGLEWMVPIIENGIVKGYNNVAVPGAKPQVDAVRVIRVQTGGQTMWIAVADGATLNVFTDACNACCEDGTPVLAAPTIIAPIIEDAACIDASGNYTYNAPIPTLLTGQKLDLEVVSCNKALLSPAPPDAGFANAAALLTWVQANLAAAGTWSLTTASVFLRLVTTLCKTAMIQVQLLKQVWCTPTITFPVTYDTVVANGVTSTFTAKTAANATELIAQVANYFPDGTLTINATTRLRYEGTGAPDRLKLINTDKAVFTVGECA